MLLLWALLLLLLLVLLLASSKRLRKLWLLLRLLLLAVGEHQLRILARAGIKGGRLRAHALERKPRHLLLVLLLLHLLLLLRLILLLVLLVRVLRALVVLASGFGGALEGRCKCMRVALALHGGREVAGARHARRRRSRKVLGREVVLRRRPRVARRRRTRRNTRDLLLGGRLLHRLNANAAGSDGGKSSGAPLLL
jgi:hypothetical protein